MDTYRFYIPDLAALIPPTADLSKLSPIPLSEDQARHAGLVLRLSPGQPIIVFDGKGSWAPAIIAGEKGARLKDKIAVKLTEHLHLEPPSPLSLTLFTAIPKGDRAEWLAEQASQLNVTALHWLDCDRSVVKLKGGAEGSHKLEKYRRLAIESAKQCGRHYLMDIQIAPPLEKLLIPQATAAKTFLWLEPRQDAHSLTIAQILHDNKPQNLSALIGPEGGWSHREFTLLEQAAQAGIATRVRLTPTVLRIETACAAIAAIVMSTR